MLELTEGFRHRLADLSDLTEHEIAQHITCAACRRAVDRDDTDRTRMCNIHPAISRPRRSQCELMLATRQGDVVTKLKLSLPEMSARASSTAAEREEAGGCEVEVSRCRCIRIDTDILRTEERRSGLHDCDPVVSESRRVDRCRTHDPRLAYRQHARAVVHAGIAGRQQIRRIVRHRRILHIREVTSEEGLFRRTLVIEPLNDLVFRIVNRGAPSNVSARVLCLREAGGDKLCSVTVT